MNIYRKGNIIYDKSTKGIEIVKYDENIDDFMKREVLPHVPDAKAFFEEDCSKANPIIKTGAEIPFTKYFYKYEQPVASEELKAYKNTITADIDEEFKALVVGNTKEEVDASYAQVKGIQNAVKEKYKVKEPLPEPKTKVKAPQKTEDLLKRLNSMSLEEYAEARKNKFK